MLCTHWRLPPRSWAVCKRWHHRVVLTTVGTLVVDAVQAILQQLDPPYDAAAGAPAAVDVTPLLDALASSQWWTGSALDVASHNRISIARFVNMFVKTAWACVLDNVKCTLRGENSSDFPYISPYIAKM